MQKKWRWLVGCVHGVYRLGEGQDRLETDTRLPCYVTEQPGLRVALLHVEEARELQADAAKTEREEAQVFKVGRE